MFLLHPQIAQKINARSVYTPFMPDGLNGATGNVLLAQQTNRLLAMGHQSLASSGGTASLCGGAAGPGGGPAGAAGGAFSGAAAIVAGGGNGACGGMPVGGQEIARFFFDGGTTYRVSPVNVDDVTEIEPLPAPGFGGGSFRMSLMSSAPGGGGRADGTGSLPGTGTSQMVNLSNSHGNARNPSNLNGGPTCPNPPTQK
jgi:hypothetical protein